MEKEYKEKIVVSKRSHRYDSWSPYCGKRLFSKLWKCIRYLVLNISLLCSYFVPWWVSSGVWSLFLKSGFKQNCLSFHKQGKKKSCLCLSLLQHSHLKPVQSSSACHTMEMLRNRYLIQFQYLYLSSLVYREYSVYARQITFIKLFWRTAKIENHYHIV